MSDFQNPLGRRRFIRNTSLATAALAVSQPFHVMGQGTKKKLRIGIVGCGGRSHSVAKMALEDGRYEITALADYFQNQADEVGGKYNVPAKRRFTGLNCFKKMIDAGGIDIVAVLTPPYFHPEQVEAAVEAGLHVYLAKPIAIDAPGVARIEAAAKKSTAKGKCFFVDFQTRAIKHFPEAARRVAAGDLGKLGYGEIEGTSTAFRLAVPHDDRQETKLRNWLQWKDLCGEAIMEFSIHAIDLASLMIGRNPVSATGQCARNFLDGMSEPRPGDVRDLWLASYDFGDGLKVQFRGKRFDVKSLSKGIYVNLFGTDGVLKADYGGEVWINGKNRFSGDKFMKEKVRGIYNIGIANNLDTFHKNITTGNCAQETVAPSIQSHYLALLGREAGYQQGKTVTWDEVVSSKKALEFDTEGLKA